MKGRERRESGESEEVFVRGVGSGDRGCEITYFSRRKSLIYDKTMLASAHFGRPQPCPGVRNVGAIVPLGGPRRPYLRLILFVGYGI